jgi:hypothetical protein
MCQKLKENVCVNMGLQGVYVGRSTCDIWWHLDRLFCESLDFPLSSFVITHCVTDVVDTAVSVTAGSSLILGSE